MDYEYEYSMLLIKQLFDHLIAREEDVKIRQLLLQEKKCLERLVLCKNYQFYQVN